MAEDVSGNLHDGQIRGIALGNHLGEGIVRASLPELGAGGSWCTCQMGAGEEPPRDVAHIQFRYASCKLHHARHTALCEDSHVGFSLPRSRIAFKLVWCPQNHYNTFVVVDDDGNRCVGLTFCPWFVTARCVSRRLASGKPSGTLPQLRERQRNYAVVAKSKFSKACQDNTE